MEEHDRPTLGYHRRAPAGRTSETIIQLLDDQHWHAPSDREVADLLEMDGREGLDLFAVEYRRARFGLDQLTPAKGPGPLRRLALQLTGPLVFILLGVAVVAVLQALFTYAPFMNVAFGTASIPGGEWVVIVGIGAGSMVSMELVGVVPRRLRVP